jgi:hypothetical protein
VSIVLLSVLYDPDVLYNRETMLMISKLLGNQKPDLIVEVETAIWDVLFQLARGSLHPRGLLLKLSD